MIRGSTIRENDDPVVGHLEEASGDRHRLFPIAHDDAQLARHQGGDEGGVLRQHGELAGRAGGDHLVHSLLGVDLMFGSDDLDREGHVARYAFASSFAISSAFSTTVSIVPTR